MDYWLLMFPPKALLHALCMPNRSLKKNNKGQTTLEELIKFFGVAILCTRFEFTSRASLWSGESYTRFHHSPNLGCTGMSRNRFDVLWLNLRFSYQPWERPEYQSSENYRWNLVVTLFASSMNTVSRSSLPPIPSVWTRVSVGGMVWEKTGSTRVFRCMSKSIRNRKTARRFKTPVARNRV
jgi:hypothetical protein